MDDIIQIRITNSQDNTIENLNLVKEIFSPLIDTAIKIGIWDDAIKAIIVTDDFKDEVEKQAKILNITVRLSQEKEYRVASKILFNQNLNNPEYYILFDFQAFHNKKFPHSEVVLGQILSISANKIFPNEIRLFELSRKFQTLLDYVTLASIDWCKAVYIKENLVKIIDAPLSFMNQNSFLIAFKRKLKKNLYEYNGDNLDNSGRIEIFWQNYFRSLHTFFLRLMENETKDPELRIKDNEKSKSLIDKVIFEIHELAKSFIENEPYNLSPLKEAIKNFSASFEIFLEEETDHNIRIRLTKDPKDYFVDEIVETEPRFVCFMDILGFSELINKYDTDITSTVLQDIHESFVIAKEHLLENSFTKNNSAIKHLKYQTFSDNICISIPYFDNENDFLTNLNLLSIYVRGFQLIMMSKGIYMRGGISMGSFYADINIIFSKGLVNAYYLESKKANYPRVLVDNSIIEKLFKYNIKNIEKFGLDSSIVFDWENIAFLNPFGISDSSIRQLETFSEDLNGDLDDPVISLLNSLTGSLNKGTIDIMKIASEKEKKELEPIKANIIENMILYRNNDNIMSKYIWLFEFLKWYENDETANLRFQKFRDIF